MRLTDDNRAAPARACHRRELRRLRRGAGDTELFELVGGVIVMMTDPTEVHEQITANIGAPLKLAMDARGCRSYQGGMRVQRSDDPRGTDKTRPDVVVRCGALGTDNFITDR